MVLQRFSGLFRIAIKSAIVYRFSFFVWLLVGPVFLFVQYFLWRSIFTYSGETAIRGFTFEQMIVYIGLSTFVNVIIWSNVDNSIADMVRHGDFARVFIRPFSFFDLRFVIGLANTAFSFVASNWFNLFIVFVFFEYAPSFYTFGLFLISLAIAYFLKFTWTFAFGLTSFWFEKYSGVARVRLAMDSIMSGAFFPLTFFPLWFQALSNYLPFQFFVYIPVKIALGQIVGFEALKLLLVQLGWAVGMYLVMRASWKYASKKFAAVGT